MWQLDQVDVKGSLLSVGCIIKCNEELLVHLIFILLRRTLEIHYFESVLFERR